MRYLIIAGFVAALGTMSATEVQAQSDAVRAMCNNKYGLGKNTPNASEAQRKDAAAKIAACIRSGGKS